MPSPTTDRSLAYCLVVADTSNCLVGLTSTHSPRVNSHGRCAHTSTQIKPQTEQILTLSVDVIDWS